MCTVFMIPAVHMPEGLKRDRFQTTSMSRVRARSRTLLEEEVKRGPFNQYLSAAKRFKLPGLNPGEVVQPSRNNYFPHDR